VLAALVLHWPDRSQAEEQLPVYQEHQDLLYYLDSSGTKRPVKAVADWENRKKHVLAHMQTVMGPLPSPETPVPLDANILDEVKVGSLTRRKIAYHTDSPERVVPAYLFLPKTARRKVPAVLCLHHTTRIGKEQPAGLGAKPMYHYALHLAQRGYVTLAPDYPSFGEYDYDFEHGKKGGKKGIGPICRDGPEGASHKLDLSPFSYISGTMKAVYDNVRAVDLLQSLPEVDPQRIGCIGHSLGGHNTMFTACFEPRIKAMVSTCGFTRFHKYYGGQLKGWTSQCYMPLIAERYNNDPDQVPFDFTEIVACFAPRPFLASAPLHDHNFEVSGVRDVITAAMPIYRLYGEPENLQADYPDCGHQFPDEAREVAYEFLDRHLGMRRLPKPTRKPLVRTIELNVGESHEIELCDGNKADVKLLDLQETRDDLRGAVRRAEAKVQVNGGPVTLVSSMYRLPTTIAGLQIDCPITKGYTENGGNRWSLGKDVRLRLWPAGSPLVAPGTFVYPIKQRWFATDTQMCNDPVYVNDGEVPAKKSIYYHWGLDFGGVEGLDEVVSATEGVVLSAGTEGIETDDPFVNPKYDKVHILDDRGWHLRYIHLKKIDEKMVPGAPVKLGQRVGVLGKEGGSGGWSHLHFDITAMQPSGEPGIHDAYAFVWEAYQRQFQPKIIAVARPHHLAWVGEKVILDGTRSWSRSGKIARYEWTFCNGAKATGPTVERTYDKPGTYSDILKVTDEEGRFDYDFAVVQIIAKDHPDQLPATIHASYHPAFEVNPGDEVTFKVRTFRTAEGREEWDFGDGSPKVSVKSEGGGSRNPQGYAATTHRYQKPGDYIVRVERTDQHGFRAIGHLHVPVGRID